MTYKYINSDKINFVTYHIKIVSIHDSFEIYRLHIEDKLLFNVKCLL